ncbi:hypothetical protein Sjap_010185 [Stephania japonica]|uniref:F-box protein n=1 Tax=Stephania japonica TaxID=461633 RepID=A0AAP0P3Z7_9MAGN
MANSVILQEDPISNPPPHLTFADFPEDVQLCALSFLTPSEITSFSCTSKHYASLCRNDAKLWFSMCHRRWGSNTQITRWGKGGIQFKFLYNILNRWENLIGFWRRSGHATAAASPSPPPLVFFEWGASFITGSKVSPSKMGTYEVIKKPFIWMSVSSKGELVSFIDPECQFGLIRDFVEVAELGGVVRDSDLIPVTISFMGKNHFVVEENKSLLSSCSPEEKFFRKSSNLGNGEDDLGGEEGIGIEGTSPGSLSGSLRSEIYQYFANRRSPGGDRASRRQRRKERERLGRQKWEPEHFVKIVNCAPTDSRPLQGLWKGICEDMSLDFYLVVYDGIGGIACRRVGDSSEPFSGYLPVFWTSNTTSSEFPSSCEEEDIYESRIHLRPPATEENMEGYPIHAENQVVLRIMKINSSYDLVILDFKDSAVNPRLVEGRIWQYVDGTFGFGFLRNNYIIDLKHMARDGCLLDAVENCCNEGPQ